MIIALTRDFAREEAAGRSGGWQHTIGPGLSGSTPGIVGLGRLGTGPRHVRDRWSPNLTPERADPHGVRAVGRAELFRDSDVITVPTPLTPSSRGLVGADDLALMKRSAYLVNTSRGEIVDETALVDAPPRAHRRGLPTTRSEGCPTPCSFPTSATSPPTRTRCSTGTSSRTSPRGMTARRSASCGADPQNRK